MSLLLNYQPLLSGPDEYESGPISIQGIALVSLGLQEEIYGELSIIGTATLNVDLSIIAPVITVTTPKHADIKSYIVRRHHEVEVSSGSAHIEIAQRKPAIKVIDID